jgi:hypothetical protein
LQKSGFLGKRSRRYQQTYTYWFVLKDDILIYYENAKVSFVPVNSAANTPGSVLSSGNDRFKARFADPTKQITQEWSDATDGQ